MSKSLYRADLVQSFAALGIGVICAVILHQKWYYGGWMAWFGDPPGSNPAYKRFLPLFESAPYVVGGLAVGAIAGFGYFELARVAIRFSSVLGLFLLALVNPEPAIRDLLPAAGVSFLVSTGLSLIYFRFLNLEESVRSVRERRQV